MISVIVPIHNVEQYIEECLDSLVQQTSQNFEAIIIDDGSTDGSTTIAKRYCDNYSNLNYYHQEDKGVSEARNLGVSKAVGEYLMFLDGDDYFTKDCIEKYEELLRDRFPDIDILVGNLYTVDGSITIFKDRDVSETDEIQQGARYYKQQLQEDNVKSTVWIHAYRRAFIEENQLRFTKDIYHEDEEYVVNAYLSAETVANSGIKHYYYRRRRPGSIMTDDANLEKRIADAKQVYLGLLEKITAIGDQELLGLFNRYWLRFFLGYVMRENKEFSKEKSKLQLDHQFIAAIDISKISDKKMRIRQKLFLLHPKIYLKAMELRGYDT